MKIFITGATGFIGKHLVEKLVKADFDVWCLVKRNSRQKDVEFLKRRRAKIIVGDIFDAICLDDLRPKVDAVVHLIGGGSVAGTTKKERENLRKLNVVSIKKLLLLFKKSDLRVGKIIYLSSVSAIGIFDKLIVDEKTQCFPKSAHGIYKMQAEEIVENSGIPFVIIRPSAVYGPMAGNSDICSVAKIIKKFHFFPIIGSGHNHLPCIDIDDLVDSIKLAIASSRAINQKIILTHEKPPTFNEYISLIGNETGEFYFMPHFAKFLLWPFVCAGEAISRLSGISFSLTRQRLISMTSDRLFSIKKAKSLLGYRESHVFKETLRKTVSWYKQNI